MKEDLDKKIYNDYLTGNKEALELLYNKYKNKIEYFIFNIVKDLQKAEDLTQETFIYVMQNKREVNCSFKYFIYLIAKSKALNYINVENRRNKITELYIEKSGKIEEDVIETILKQENKKELLESIEQIDEKYRNAVYLICIEELTYEEISQILGENLQNTKNLIHRGRKQLRKLLIKKLGKEMNKVSKILVMFICISIILAGIVYAATHIYKNINSNHNITINPTYKSTLEESTINNLWIGTLDLAWKELIRELGTKVEIEENLDIINKLNESTFTKEMLNPNDYEIDIEKTLTNGYNIEATLKKKLNFLETFDNFSKYYDKWTFGNGTEYIKYFGINDCSLEKKNENIEILFYNEMENNKEGNDFAVTLKTKEGDKIILYRTNESKSFDEYYNEIKNKSKEYKGEKEFGKGDTLKIPYIKLNGIVSYNQLYGKIIKNSGGNYFTDVIQNVNFSLSEKGCNLSSQATMVTETIGVTDGRECSFDDNFILFIQEKYSDNPYFALKVENDDILEKIEETEEPQVIDYTMISNEEIKVEEGEYKFFEDDNYGYYYPNQKTKYVHVYFKNGDDMTAEQALKNGKVTLELLDKYGVKYMKKLLKDNR